MLDKAKLGPIDRVPGKAWFWLAVVLGVAFVLALQQKECGRFFSKTVALDSEIAKGKPVGEHGFRINIPKRFRNNATVERGFVHEAKEPLPIRASAIRHVTEQGHGRFRIKGRQIYFSATDNSDPRTNNKPYELRAPRNVKNSTLWLTLIACVACIAMALRAGAKPPAFKPPRALEAILVFGLSAGVMLWALGRFADLSDGWLEVQGAPFSDSIAWLELAESLAEGRGFNGPFESHRGGYPLLLGSVFALNGEGSLIVAKLFNVAMLSLAAAFLYFFARSGYGRAMAILLLATLLIEERFEVLVQYTLTEPTGFALGAIGLYLFHRAALTRAPASFALAGIFLGLSNLARPFTLLALPAFGLLLLLAAVRGRWGWRPFAIRGALFVSGAFLIFGPWMARQKVDWGVTTLDLNSAVMLYGAAAEAPEGMSRTLASRHYLEAEAAGIPRSDRTAAYHFFMRRYKEEVARDLGGYLKYVGGCFLNFFDQPGFNDGHIRSELGTAFFLALAFLAVRLRLAFLVLPAGLWPWIADMLDSTPSLLVVTISVVLAFAGHAARGRFATALLTCSLVGAGVLNALVGNFALNRGTVFIEWIIFLLVAAGMFGAARLILKLAKSPEPDRGDVGDDPAPLRLLPIAILSVFALGFGILFIRNATAAPPDAEAWLLDDKQSQSLIAAWETNGAELPEGVFTGTLELGEYRWFIHAGQDLGHWSRFFEILPYDRTMVLAKTGYDPETEAEIGRSIRIPTDVGELDGKQRFAILGLFDIDENAHLGNAREVIHALMVAPYDPESGTIDYSSALRFPLPSAEPVR